MLFRAERAGLPFGNIFPAFAIKAVATTLWHSSLRHIRPRRQPQAVVETPRVILNYVFNLCVSFITLKSKSFFALQAIREFFSKPYQDRIARLSVFQFTPRGTLHTNVSRERKCRESGGVESACGHSSLRHSRPRR